MAADDSIRFTVSDLAKQVGGTLHGDGDVQISGINTLADAKAGDITFIASRAYASQWPASKAAAAVVTQGAEPSSDRSRPLIIVRDAEQAIIRFLELFQRPEPAPDLGIHPTAVVHASATLGSQVRIGPLATIDRDVHIGDGAVIHAGVRLYPNVKIGPGTVIHANTVVRHDCVIGRGVILHQNVSIGADGFGYRPAPNGAGLLKVPHIGNVIIEDGVEIGANTCVDRGKFGSTIIGAGTKIDNLCQIAHNCRIGRCCLIAGHVGIAGSVTIGDGTQMAGQVGVIDHVQIGKGVKIGARGAVFGDIADGAVVLGYPADDGRAVLRQWVAIRKLPDLLRKMKAEK